jgi:serine acetyltransferase
VAEVDL